jgi:hypothetical protein
VTDEHAVFLDGRRHDDEPIALNGWYDYFCPSGGMPLPTFSDWSARVWVLDGWTREEAVACLARVLGAPREEAGEAFRLCGGSIGGMVYVCGGEAKARAKRDQLDHLLRALPDSAVPLAVHSTLQQEDGAGLDRLRTMFWDRAGHGDYARRMYALQIVDSEYVLDRLRRRQDVCRVLDTFRKAVALRPNRKLQGRYFELLIHKFVEKNHNLSTADARCKL